MADEASKPQDTQPLRRRKNRDAPIEATAVDVTPVVSEPVSADAVLAEAVAPDAGIPAETEAPLTVEEPAAAAPTQDKPEPKQGIRLVPLLMVAVLAALLGSGAVYLALRQGLLPLGPANDPRMAALEKSVADVAARPGDTALRPRLEAVEAKQRELDQKIASLPAFAAFAGQATPSNGDIAALRSEIAALRQQVPAAPAASGGDTAALAERLAKIEAEMASLSASNKEANGQRDALSQKIGQLDVKAAQTQSVGNRAAMALAVSTLRNALDSGNSFTNEYRALRAMAGNDPGLAALEAAAAKGIPTVVILRQRFRNLTPALLRAVPSQAAEGWLAQVRQSLEGMISIRQVGEASGNDPQAIVSRIDGHLQRSDLAKAAEEFALLPEPVRLAGKEWHDQLTLRLAAETQLNTMARAALQALADAPK